MAESEPCEPEDFMFHRCLTYETEGKFSFTVARTDNEYTVITTGIYADLSPGAKVELVGWITSMCGGSPDDWITVLKNGDKGKSMKKLPRGCSIRL